MYYHMTVAGLERDLPICPLNEKLSIAGFVIFGDQELTVACARDLLAKAPEYDYIITAEAKGIPLAHEMARQAGDAKYILARKGPKLYMRDIFSVTVNSITTAKEQKLYLDGADAVGMSTVPEAIVAAQCGIKCLGISCITNLAAGVSPNKLSHQEVMDTAAMAHDKFHSLVDLILKTV